MNEDAQGSQHGGAWHEIVRDVLKRHQVQLVTYVPDNVLRPLIDAVHADPFFTAFSCAREEEAVGIVSGAWMGGLRGIVLMQTSGFATLPNAIASLAVPFQIPVLMMVSERGTLGEFNIGQSLVARTMRPVLQALAVEHHTMTRLDEVEFIVDRGITQAVATRAPCVFILSPLLTGGKVFGK
jgi:sulfopyruvate decarboxylase alpha subunit